MTFALEQTVGARGLYSSKRPIAAVGKEKRILESKLVLMNPVLAVSDISSSISYFQDKLGFVMTWSWGEPLVRAGVSKDGYELQLDASGSGPTGISVVYFHTNNVAEYYEQCIERGATIELRLEERSFGMRDFRVLDPSGNRLGFGEPVVD